MLSQRSSPPRANHANPRHPEAGSREPWDEWANCRGLILPSDWLHQGRTSTTHIPNADLQRPPSQRAATWSVTKSLTNA
jgi:hypothetical protein